MQQRRRMLAVFSFSLVNLLSLGSIFSAQAQTPAALVEGKTYRTLKTEQPTDAPNKIEVIEFFSYGCPHCFSFEPSLNPWIKALPTDVAFKRVPVGFNADFAPLQRLYYALDALGKEEALHTKVFEAIHVQHRNLGTLDAATEFAVQNGISAEQFKSAYNAFGVQSRIQRANQLMSGHQVDGVPMLSIDGRYTTSASMAGGHENALLVANALIEKARAKKGWQPKPKDKAKGKE